VPSASDAPSCTRTRFRFVAFTGSTVMQISACEISGSQGGEYEAQNILGCTAVFLIGCRPTFQRCVLLPSSGPSSVCVLVFAKSTHLPY
jgi:hypothetical protein